MRSTLAGPLLDSEFGDDNDFRALAAEKIDRNDEVRTAR